MKRLKMLDLCDEAKDILNEQLEECVFADFFCWPGDTTFETRLTMPNTIKVSPKTVKERSERQLQELMLNQGIKKIEKIINSMKTIKQKMHER